MEVATEKNRRSQRSKFILRVIQNKPLDEFNKGQRLKNSNSRSKGEDTLEMGSQQWWPVSQVR